MSKNKKRLNAQRHDFLRTFFFHAPNQYAWTEVNGFVLEQRYNSSGDKWEVGIYTKQSWRERNKYKEAQEQRQHLLEI